MAKTQSTRQDSANSVSQNVDYGLNLGSRVNDSGIDLTQASFTQTMARNIGRRQDEDRDLERALQIASTDTGINLSSDTSPNLSEAVKREKAAQYDKVKEHIQQMPGLPEGDKLTRKGARTLDPEVDRKQLNQIVSKKENAEYRQQVRAYGQVEKKLIAAEERLAQNNSRGVWGIVGSFLAQREVRALRNELQGLLKEQKEMITQVQKRANSQQMDSFIQKPAVPMLLRRASVPEAKQGKLLGFNHLVTSLMFDPTAGKPPEGTKVAIQKSTDAYIINRETIADPGKSHSLMFRHHSDGRVTLYLHTPDSQPGEWKRLGVVWSDDALKISQRFIEGNKLPRLVPPKDGRKWLIEPVELKEREKIRATLVAH